MAWLAKRIGVQPAVIMTGGLAINQSPIDALASAIGTLITVARMPQLVGALEAALYEAAAFNHH